MPVRVLRRATNVQSAPQSLTAGLPFAVVVAFPGAAQQTQQQTMPQVQPWSAITTVWVCATMRRPSPGTPRTRLAAAAARRSATLGAVALLLFCHNAGSDLSQRQAEIKQEIVAAMHAGRVARGTTQKAGVATSPLS
jgi:hypothetical protein